MKAKWVFLIAIVVLLVLSVTATLTLAQSPTGTGQPRAPRIALDTEFTYQGQLENNGSPVNGTCNFKFGLWDATSLGSQIGTTVTVPSVTVTNGLFTAPIDFGANAFNGDARYLGIAVACPSGSYTPMSTRQALTPAPYALTALKTAYKNVLVVAKSGGHYNTITAALNSISDASDTNRYLVYVAPGVYTETVTMKQFVDIEGAGELTTKITQIGSGSSITGTVIGASNAELRFLTVENTGGNTYATAIYNSSASPHLTHVTATASGGTAYNYGVSNSSSSPTMTDVSVTASGGSGDTGVWNSSSSLTMTNVTILALNGSSGNVGVANRSSSTVTMMNVTVNAFGGTGASGIDNSSSSATIHNSLISASGGTTSNFGVSNTASTGVYTVTVDNSQIVGSGRTIYNDSHFTTRVGASKLDGGTVFVNGGTITCAGVYDESYVFYASTCP